VAVVDIITFETTGFCEDDLPKWSNEVASSFFILLTEKLTKKDIHFVWS